MQLGHVGINEAAVSKKGIVPLLTATVISKFTFYQLEIHQKFMIFKMSSMSSLQMALV